MNDQPTTKSTRLRDASSKLRGGLSLALGCAVKSVSTLLSIFRSDLQSVWLRVKTTGGRLRASGVCRQQINDACERAAQLRSRGYMRVLKEQALLACQLIASDYAQIKLRIREVLTITPQRQSVRELSPFADYSRSIIWASVIINLLALAFPLLMLQLYDRILPRQSLDTLLIFTISVGVALLLETITRIARSYLTAWVSARFEHAAMMSLASKNLASSLHTFERNGTGQILGDFRAVSTLKGNYAGQTFQQLIDLPFTLFYVLIVMVISPVIGLMLVFGYAVFVIVSWKLGQGCRNTVIAQSESDVRRGNFINELFTNIHTVKALTLESQMMRRYERLQERSAGIIREASYNMDISVGMGAVFSPLMNVLVVALGAWLVINHDLTNGELAACVLLGLRALAPLQKIGAIWNKYQQDEVLRDRLGNLLEAPGLPVDTPVDAARKLDFIPCAVSLKNITYSFPSTHRQIFDGLNLSIAPGECVVIEGKPGSGRSTLMQVIAGMVTPDSGEVLINNIPIAQLDQRLLREHLAYLPQQPMMFDGTLLDNITLFTPENIAQAMKAADSLGLESLISRMPRGWDSPVGDQAADSLPPGYRQRIAIARALSNYPGIILYDEASSWLDAEGDLGLLRFLQSIRGKVTIVMATERPSYRKIADRVLYLEDGKIVSQVASVNQSGHEDDVERCSISALTSQKFVKHHDAYGHDSLHYDDVESMARMGQAISNSFKQSTDFADCLPLLLRLMNVKQTAREVVESLPYYSDTLDLPGFQNTMSQLGFSVRSVACRLRDIDRRSLPCLFVPDGQPAMVLMSRAGDQMRVGYAVDNDPVLESNLDLAGRAYFYEAVAAQPRDNTSWVRNIVDRFVPLLTQAIISSFVSGLVMLAAPIFLMVVYSTVIPTGSLSTLFDLSVGAVIAVVSSYYFVRHRAMILAYVGSRMEFLFGTSVLKQILRMQPSLTERSSVGAQTARMHSFDSLRDIFTGTLANSVLDIPATIILLIGLSLINPVALIVFVVMVVVYGALFWMFDRRTQIAMASVGQATTRRTEFLTEMVSKMRAIRECGAQHIWLNRFREISADASMAAYNAEKLSSLLAGVSYMVMMCSGLLIASVTAPYIMDATLGSGVLIASMLLMWRVLTPMQSLFINLPRVNRVRSTARQIDALMRIQGERPDNAFARSGRVERGLIEFQRVSFRYNTYCDPALVGVDFRINPGEVVAISGANGSGKSTLMKLILGMYQPQAGSILIDSVDIRQIDPLELRRMVAYAPQESQFFRATIAQNLRFAQPDATDDELVGALEMAGALGQIQALPGGLEFRIGDNTHEISGSLKQKLMLARIYLTRASIILFDEPGSGLDEAGDACFMEVIQALKGHATVLFSSHRPSHIRLADTLMVFDKGYLRAAGPPETLLRPASEVKRTQSVQTPLPPVAR